MAYPCIKKRGSGCVCLKGEKNKFFLLKRSKRVYCCVYQKKKKNNYKTFNNKVFSPFKIFIFIFFFAIHCPLV